MEIQKEGGAAKKYPEKYFTIIIEDNLEMAGARKIPAAFIIIIAAAEHSGWWVGYVVAVGSSIFNSSVKIEKLNVSVTVLEKYINRVGSAATFATEITLGFGRGYFFVFFRLFLPYFCQMNDEGGVPMDDEDIFEMFQELIAQLDSDDPEGRMRLISKIPVMQQTILLPKNQNT